MKYEDGMLILGQNDILCGHNVIIFFLNITFSNGSMEFFNCLVAACHVTEPGLSLCAPGAVIKFNTLLMLLWLPAAPVNMTIPLYIHELVYISI